MEFFCSSRQTVHHASWIVHDSVSEVLWLIFVMWHLWHKLFWSHQLVFVLRFFFSFCSQNKKKTMDAVCLWSGHSIYWTISHKLFHWSASFLSPNTHLLLSPALFFCGGALCTLACTSKSFISSWDFIYHSFPFDL